VAYFLGHPVFYNGVARNLRGLRGGARGSGRRKSPSGVHGQSPGRGSRKRSPQKL